MLPAKTDENHPQQLETDAGHTLFLLTEHVLLTQTIHKFHDY